MSYNGRFAGYLHMTYTTGDFKAFNGRTGWFSVISEEMIGRSEISGQTRSSTNDNLADSSVPFKT